MINTTDNLLISKQRNATVRTGIIQEINTTATTLLVTVGNATVEAGFLQPYVPTVGDLVAVIRQDSSWLVLGEFNGTGLFDTGWIPFTLNAPFTQSGGGDVPSYRRMGNRVFWKGRVGDAGGVANGVAIFTVPAGFRPSGTDSGINYGWAVARSANAGVSSTCRVDIVATTAVFRTFDTTALAPTWVGLDGIEYMLD